MQRILIGNIKGPQGAQGIQGPQGPVGATGPQGPMPDLVNNALATEAGVAALDAVMGKTLQDQITDLNSNITDQTDLVVIEVTDFAASTATAINCPWQNYQFLIITFGMYNNITVSHMVPVVFFRTTAAAKRVLLYNPTNINAFCQCYQNGEGSIIIDLSSDMVALTNYRIHVYGVLAR